MTISKYPLIELIVTNDDCQSAEEVASGLMIVMESILLIDVPCPQGPVLPQGWKGAFSRAQAASHLHTASGKEGRGGAVQDAGCPSPDTLCTRISVQWRHEVCEHEAPGSKI